MTAIGEKNAFDLLLVALRFNEKINQRDLEGLAELMADDYTFIDNCAREGSNPDQGANMLWTLNFLA